MTTSAIPEDVARRRNRRDARVRAYDDLKERRARLAAGTSIKPEFEYELLTMFARNELGAAVTMPALYALFAIACMFWAPTVDAVVWLIIVIGAKVILLDLARRFLVVPPAQVNIRAWRRRFTLAELFNGLALACFALIGVRDTLGAPSELVFSSHVFIFATLIVVLAHPHDVRGDDPGDPLRGHRADDDRGRGAPADPRQLVLLCPGNHGGRHPSLLPVSRPWAPIDGPVDARVPQREGRANRRAGGAEIRFRRSAPPRRGCQQRQVAIPRHHEPRAAHPA